MKVKDNIVIAAYAKLIIKMFNKESSDLIPMTMEKARLIEQKILTLDIREQGIVELHWGLNGDKKLTLKQIGNKFGVSAQRIRQLEKNLFRKLRSKSRLGKETYFFSDLNRKLDEIEDILKKHEELKQRIKIIEELLPDYAQERLLRLKQKSLFIELDYALILNRPVSDFEFTARILNCFNIAGIKTMRDLVARRERQLLMIRNFSHKSIIIVKEILAEHNLRLGMLD